MVQKVQQDGPPGRFLEDSNDAEADALPGSNPLITPNDMVIAVMGVTGVGKSAFISLFSDSAKVGQGLESCTIDVGIHEARIGSHRCFLIDTPGFDDTHRSDTDVLRDIADWLNRAYKASIQLSGIVYLHRITDPRVGGSSLKNLRMFKKLCGADGLSCVVLATTMWNQIDAANGERREEELICKAEFWGDMIKRGSTVMRHDQNEVSATNIIQHILSVRSRMVLDIQKEMASGKSLDETSAGQELEAELERMRRKYEDEMKELREDMMEAQRKNDRASQEEIAKIRAELQQRMKQEREDREKMRVNMEELRRERDEELRNERQKIAQLAWDNAKKLADKEHAIIMMEMTANHKIEMAKHELRMKTLKEKNDRWEAAEAERKLKENGCVLM